MKKVVKYSIFIILFSILIVEIIKVITLFDINGIISISYDEWIRFFGTLLEILVAIIGFTFTIYKFLNQREEKEKPLNFQTKNRYVISIDINFMEGMRSLYCKLF